MLKLSRNQKTNALYNAIYEDLMESLGVDEIKRYRNEFRYESDWNIVEYGNLLVYYSDIYALYRNCGYKSTDKMSPDKIWEAYKRSVRHVAWEILRGVK